MSEKIVPLALAKHKPTEPPDTPASEPRPTRLEHAELTARIFDFDLTMETDLVRVMVVADKLSRAVELGIRGYKDAIAHELEEAEDLDVLQELASGLKMLCNQAKDLIAAGPGAEPWTSPAAKGGPR